jgi:hypothetical protein
MIRKDKKRVSKGKIFENRKQIEEKLWERGGQILPFCARGKISFKKGREKNWFSVRNIFRPLTSYLLDM